MKLMFVRSVVPFAVALTALVGAGLGAQEPAATTSRVQRPIPAAVVPPQGYVTALERGWRSRDGSPGGNYWRQGIAYDLVGRLDPDSARLEGSVRITYANNAPARLSTIFLHLHQNFHRPESPRHETAEITEGITLLRVAVEPKPAGEDDDDASDETAAIELEERDLSEGPGYDVDGTLVQLRPPSPIEQGDTLRLTIDFVVDVPQAGVGARMGHSDHEMYFIAYWFPKVAVLDDVRTWDAEPFLGGGEFYDEFGDYTAELTVPAGWTVMATGELQNPREVYSPLTLERLEQAAASDERVTVAGQGERDAGTVTTEGTDGWLTYRYAAANVRDFAWTASDVQQWDATSAVVPDRDEDGQEDRVLIHAFWRPDRAPLWDDGWLFAKQSIEFHSRYTGLAYPWPHMTAVEGADIIGGGMEFPMLTLIGPYTDREPQLLYNVIAHELAHMWIPMIVGTNEKRYAWMDEGSTDFLEDESRMELWPGVDHHRVEARQYLQVAAGGQEQSMMRHADYYEPGPGYTIASYRKPAALMTALRQVIGRETWEEAYRAFISEWAFKHPTPWDFFATFERFAGRDLDWFWTAFYFETWTLDHAVREVTSVPGGGQTVVVEDRGTAPFPVTVRIRTATGQTLDREIPVEHWLAGETAFSIPVSAEDGRVTRVEIDPSGYAPDVDRENNLWPRS